MNLGCFGDIYVYFPINKNYLQYFNGNKGGKLFSSKILFGKNLDTLFSGQKVYIEYHN